MKKITPPIPYLKHQAKKIKKQKGIKYAQALDIVAKQYDCNNWKHLLSIHIQKTILAANVDSQVFHISFTDWLKRQKNRDSPLGDLSTDMLRDKTWPQHNTLEEYESYLYFNNAAWEATETLKRAWKTYLAYLKKKNMPVSDKSKGSNYKPKNLDSRRITFFKDITPIHISKRTTEKFNPSDKAWISWEGRKAIPVTILKVDDRHYTFRIERPLNKKGDQHFLFLDEVRSTPELACMNHVTL